MLTGNFIFRCNNCHRNTTLDPGDVDFQHESSSDEPMGAENQYGWTYEGNCEYCDNEIKIEGRLSEYPIGSFNHEDEEMTGGIVVQRFGYDFFGPEENQE